MLHWLFRVLLVLAGAAALSGCLRPPSATARVTTSARQLNVAARFGRLDVAASHAANEARESFLERRAGWGRQLRVVDTQLAGLEMQDPHRAMLQVDIAWVRMNESRLRSTRIAQQWKDSEGGWKLFREKRVAGDLGLFGEDVPASRRPRRDTHFPSRTIH